MSRWKEVIADMENLVNKMRNGEEIEATEVRRVETPDGPMHLRRKVRMNEDKSIKRCLVVKLNILGDHPMTPNLKIAHVMEQHQLVVGNHYDDGILGIFIPDGAIVPDKLAEEMWVLGKLAGKKRNRVKARDFLGEFSAGLFYGSRFWIVGEDGQKEYQPGPSWNPDWIEGQDVTAEIGVTFKEET